MLPHCNRGKKTIFAADFPVLLYAGNSNFLLNVRISCRNSGSNPICVIPVLGYSAWCHQRHPRVFPSVHPGLVSSELFPGEPVRKVSHSVISPLPKHRRRLITLRNSDFSDRLGGAISVILSMVHRLKVKIVIGQENFCQCEWTRPGIRHKAGGASQRRSLRSLHWAAGWRIFRLRWRQTCKVHI